MFYFIMHYILQTNYCSISVSKSFLNTNYQIVVIPAQNNFQGINKWHVGHFENSGLKVYDAEKHTTAFMLLLDQESRLDSWFTHC